LTNLFTHQAKSQMSCEQYDAVFEQETILKAVERLTKCWVTLVENHGIITIDKDTFRTIVEQLDFFFSMEHADLVTEVYMDCEAQYLKQIIDPNQTTQRRLNGLLTCALKQYMNKETYQNRNYVGFCEFTEALLQQEQVTVEWQLLCFQHRDDFFHSQLNHVYRFATKPTHVTTQYPLLYFPDATEPLSIVGIEN
jgi:hypothetical protein